MSDPNYPDDIRQYDNDPRSPFYKDKTATPEFEDERLEITKERINDIGGYFLESFSEVSDKLSVVLAKLVIEWLEAPTDRVLSIEFEIGRIVATQISDYCTPDDSDVIESLQD